MKHSKLITVAIFLAGLILYKIVGRSMFTVLFATTFMVLFLAPIVIIGASIITGKKFNGMIRTYETTKEIENVRQLIVFLEKKKYKGAVDFKFFNKMRDFYNLVESNNQLSQSELERFKAALAIYNLKIDAEIDEALLETT